MRKQLNTMRPSRIIVGLISLLFISLSLVLFIKAIQQEQDVTPEAAAPSTTISLQASNMNPGPNQDVLVEVRLQPGTNPIGSARLVINYSSTKLTLVSSSASVNNFFSIPGLITQSTIPGAVTLRFFASPAGVVNSAYPLTTLQFRTASNYTGTSTVQLSSGTYIGALNNDLPTKPPQNDISNPLPVVLTLGVITPTPIPATSTVTPTTRPTSTPTPIPATPTPTPAITNTQITGNISTLKYDRSGNPVIEYPAGIRVWAKNNTTSVITGPVLTEKIYSIYWTPMNRYTLNVPANQSYTIIGCTGKNQKATKNIGTISGTYFKAPSFQINLLSAATTCP